MKRPLMTHPEVSSLTALAFELVIGTPERFHCGKQIASYVGLVPSNYKKNKKQIYARNIRISGSFRRGWTRLDAYAAT